jgi:putative hydrolase of the HAD superfamily
MSIRAVFFDFGGVIGRLDREQIRTIESRYGLPENGLLKAVYGIPEWRDAEIGRGSEARWVGAVNRKLDEMVGRPGSGIHLEWRTMWRDIDRDVVRLAQRLKASYRVGVLSNSTRRLERHLLKPYGLLEVFHVVINSARVGVAKPDTRIYHAAAKSVGEPPEACVHIDDLEPNVHGAREAGFHAIHHRGDFGTLERELRALGLAW